MTMANELDKPPMLILNQVPFLKPTIKEHQKSADTDRDLYSANSNKVSSFSVAVSTYNNFDIF